MLTSHVIRRDNAPHLPMEILCAIYLEVINLDLFAFDIPILRFSHVCRFWRACAFSSPFLWTRLDVPVDRPGHGPSAIAEMFIRLSRNLPMVWFIGYMDEHGSDPYLPFLSDRPFDWEQLRVNAHRCKQISFTEGVSSIMFSMLFPAGTNTHLLNLEHMMINLPDSEHKYSHNLSAIGQITAPKLIHLFTDDSRVCLHLLGPHPPSSLRLASIRPWDDNAPDLLSACRESLRILNLNCDTKIARSIPDLGWELIDVPVLKHILVSPVSGVDLLPFTSLLDAPGLESIEIRSDRLKNMDEISDAMFEARHQSFHHHSAISIGPVCPDGMKTFLERMSYLTLILLENMDRENTLKMLQYFLDPELLPDLGGLYLVRCEIEVNNDLKRQVREKRKEADVRRKALWEEQNWEFEEFIMVDLNQ
jgi:hypothetical protein